MRYKPAAIFLMISSIFWIISELYWIIQRFISLEDNYFSNKPLALFFTTFIIIVPISLLVFSIALLNSRSESVKNEKELVISQNNEPNLSVGDWLINFLISIIPFVGLIFIIIWANDDKNKVRKNWAVASLIWAAITFVLSVFFVIIIFGSVIRRFNSF